MSVKADTTGSVGRRRVRNPQGQGGRLRAELIAAADMLLARTGDFGGLSLRAVAREVGIATPSIYLHFPDKGALMRAVLDVRFAELARAIECAVATASSSADQLKAGCLAYCRFAAEQPHAYRVLFGRAPTAGPWGSRGPMVGWTGLAPPASDASHAGGASIPAGATAFTFLVDGIAACMRAGAAPPADPTRVAVNVWTALHGMVSLRASLPAFPWPPLERQLDDTLLGLVRLHHNPPPSEG